MMSWPDEYEGSVCAGIDPHDLTKLYRKLEQEAKTAAGNEIVITRLPGTLTDLMPLPDVRWLGIGHKARHGKDTAARLIHTLQPAKSVVMSFADDLKAFCRARYGMAEKDGNLLQKVGHAVRQQDADHWVKCIYARAKEAVAGRKTLLVIVPDVRMKNEAAFIKLMGGTLIKVERLDENGALFIDKDRDPTHNSEVDLDAYTAWDYVLHNTRSYSEFEGEVTRWWSEHAVSIL